MLAASGSCFIHSTGNTTEADQLVGLVAGSLPSWHHSRARRPVPGGQAGEIAVASTAAASPANSGSFFHSSRERGRALLQGLLQESSDIMLDKRESEMPFLKGPWATEAFVGAPRVFRD